MINEYITRIQVITFCPLRSSTINIRFHFLPFVSFSLCSGIYFRNSVGWLCEFSGGFVIHRDFCKLKLTGCEICYYFVLLILVPTLPFDISQISQEIHDSLMISS